MEVADTPTATRPPTTGSKSTPAPRTSPRRNPVSPKRSVREAKFKRVSPKSSTASGKDASTARAASKSTRSTQASAKPLVPVTERRSHDEKYLSKGNRDVEAERWEVVPDGGSGGREGRQFTVANVGNNGRIYLRPSIRPAHQRYPQPNFTFPVTPPGTAGLDALSHVKKDIEVDSDLHHSQWTPTPRPSPPSDKRSDLPDLRSVNTPTRHRRALSDSTAQDGKGVDDPDSGGFKIVISKPGDEQRPRTTEDVNPGALSHLDINIPSWRIGVPRFTSTGTPLIRGSSYAPSYAQSEDFQSVSGSLFSHSQKDLNVTFPPLGPRRLSTLRVPQARFSSSTQCRSPGLRSPNTPHPLRSTFMSTRTVIDAPMYDDLTFTPACDDRSIVRYAAATGAVTAATPPRLVAEITSPSFLDYELISDFFLTFRAFLEPEDLLRMLIARFRWALVRSDSTGLIVHVRAFVAMRHWILNYFMDDFVVEYSLRADFCRLLNDLVEEVSQDPEARKVRLKALNELKKCWRRVCAYYWDGPDFEGTTNLERPIVPGGIAGHRDPNLDPSFWDKDDVGPPQLSSLFAVPETTPTSFYADVSRAGHVGDSVVVDQRPATPENQQTNVNEKELGPLSPTSLASMDVISCSFPSKQMRGLHPNIGQPLAAHPASSSSIYKHTGPVATTPKTLVGKRVRPNPQHRPNNSIPESPDEQSPEKILFKENEFLMASPHAGRLVRGDVFPPGQPFVEVAHSDRIRQTTVFQTEEDDMDRQGGPADAMSSRGMKRLIGSVRRAISARGQGISPIHGPIISSSGAVPWNATSNRLPGTAVVPQQPSSRDGARPPVRIDLLGADVTEDFKRAVREDAAADAKQHEFPQELPQSAPTQPGFATTQMGASAFGSLLPNQRLRPPSDTALTGGSKSIVIVDGTVPPGGSEAHGGLPTATPSVEAFADILVPNGADITPPTTPPTNHGELARRSSHLLNENIQTSISPEPLPPFVPDLATLGAGSTAPASEDGNRMSQSTTHRSHRRPPLSGALTKMHRRDRSTRTHRSLNSIVHRRNGSYNSDMAPPSTIRSFESSFCTRHSALEEETGAPMPKPLRVLRRRPGGNLRAATNVDELDPKALRRSHSLGSMSIFTESLRSSRVCNHRPSSAENVASSVMSGEYQGRFGVFSVGQLADKRKKPGLSLCSTRSSKPVMRPSLEAEAKILAQIPDDEDGGGVESALLKLEGRFDKRPSKLSMDLKPPVELKPEDGVESESTSVDVSDRESQEANEEHRRSTLKDEAFTAQTDLDHAHPTPGLLDVPRASTAGQESFLSDASRESYSSIPLLDRGLTDDDQSKGATRNWTDRSVLQDDNEAEAFSKPPAESHNHTHLSFDFIQKTDSMDNIKPGETVPRSTEEESFLDSDLSSELSVDGIETEKPEQVPASSPKAKLPTHPLGGADTAPGETTPSPQNVHAQILDASPESGRLHRYSDKDEPASKPLPPNPEATPGLALGSGSPFDPVGTSRPPFEPDGDESDSFSKYSVHLPFILAFDSETLAQQFTLIEKDALNEIDWKELVDMDWRNDSNHSSRSWVDFLRNTDAHGVEVVIARFNLVVKWVISEIVLTQNIEERAKCIIKFIHIAANCRQHRNFATLAQLTIAMSGNEVSRLARTWELVPNKDMKTLRELETLVTPMRNFYNLRAEMESGPDDGCIPFVGIYTHDLLYNAQRPSEIASSPTTAPLVNFERCRIGAGVVKTLLRLLEASTRYNFQPIEGITERCLWIGALGDDEIRRHSGNLE